jgi:hypothetical protein
MIESHRGQGSGFFVSPDGLAITNAHVVRGSRDLIVATPDGERFRAAIQKIDNFTDLALLRIETPFSRSFPFIEGRAYIKDVPMGKDVLAFGNPKGLTWTMTRGVVSTHRKMSIEPGWAGKVLLIQHDAAVAPGSSGGPLVNLYGEWVGVNTLMVGDLQGFNFAVPADEYHYLVARENYGLRDDWLSYFTEAFVWQKKFYDLQKAMDDALRDSPVTQITTIYAQYLTALRDLYVKVESYHPTYKEIQYLQALFLESLIASDLHVRYYFDVKTFRRLWSQRAADTYFYNYRQVRDAHDAEWDRIRGMFRN